MESSVYSKPEKVAALNNSKVVQVACGTYHTVKLIFPFNSLLFF